MARFSFSKSYNKERVFDINTEDFDYVSLESLYNSVEDGHVFPVRGIYINEKSLYDPAPVIATDDCYVNFPSHMYKQCVDILNDKRAIAAINNGMVGFSIYEYEQKRFHKTCYSIRWEDIDPEIAEDIEG